jgi:hypothetical protein
VKKKLPKVNRELAARLLEGGGDEEVAVEDGEALIDGAKKDGRRKKMNTALLKDDRFAAIFKDEVNYVFTKWAHHFILTDVNPLMSPRPLVSMISKLISPWAVAGF